MKFKDHKCVREMKVERSPRDTGNIATITIYCADNGGLWEINGEPMPDSEFYARLAECGGSLEDARDNHAGHWH